MDFEEFTSDLSGLTRMAMASRERLADVAGRVTAVRERLQRLLADVEQDPPPTESAES